jgi:hypothetical protein
LLVGQMNSQGGAAELRHLGINLLKVERFLAASETRP